MVTIPTRTNARATPSGRGVVTPGPRNVQAVGRQEGSGVPNVPDPITADGEVGAALFQVGATLRAAEDRIQRQRETYQRIRAQDAFTEEFNQKLLSLEAEGIDDPAQLEAFGQEMQARAGELIETHPGGEESRLQLAGRIDKIRSSLADKAAVMSTKARRALIINSTNGKLSAIGDRARTEDAPLSELFDQVDQVVEEVAPVLDTVSDIDLKNTGRSLAVQGKFDRLMGAGDLEGATALLNDPGVPNILGKDKAIDLRGRIDKAKNQVKFTTLSQEQIKSELGFDPPDGMIIQRNNSGELKVVAKGESKTFKPALNAQGEIVFADQQQIESGEVTPVPPSALVNIQMQQPGRGMDQSGKVVSQPKSQTPVGGIKSPTSAKAPTPAPTSPPSESEPVGLFPFLSGKEQLDQKKQVDALKANISLLDRISEDIKTNPTNYGAFGTAKRVAQKTVGVASDIGDALDSATGMNIRQHSGELFGRLVSEGFDKEISMDFNPTLPKIELWENTLALQLAKLRLGQGDTEVRAITKAYNDAKGDVKLTGFTFSSDVERRVEEIRRQFQEELDNLSGALSGESSGDDLDKKVNEILGVGK